MQKRGIVGIGNALVDIMTPISDDKVLSDFNLPKGSMTLVDKEFSERLQDKTSDIESILTTGGAVANTMKGVARLGIKSGYIGAIADDNKGEFFKERFNELGIECKFKKTNSYTGRVVALVSEDGERTFATHLGAAIEMQAKDITPELFKGYEYLFIEGYLVQNHELILTAAMVAKEQGLKIAFDMASFNLVEENRDILSILVEEYIDILFANEDEAKAFCGTEPEEALELFANQCEIAVVKIGAKGALVKSKGETFKIDVYGGSPIDTTGAGDLFAAGFMSGLCKGYSLDKCGKMGAITGGISVSVLGPTIPEDKWKQIDKLESEL